MRVLLSPGHGWKKKDKENPYFDPGAVRNLNGKQLTESFINELVIEYTLKVWQMNKYPFQLWTTSYKGPMEARSNQNRAKDARGYDVVIYCHHNSSVNPEINRSEVLYCGETQKDLAMLFLNHLALKFPVSTQAGRVVDLAKEPSATSRGKSLLEIPLDPKSKTKCRHALILEPFFISCKSFETLEQVHLLCAAEAKAILETLQLMYDLISPKVKK